MSREPVATPGRILAGESCLAPARNAPAFSQLAPFFSRRAVATRNREDAVVFSGIRTTVGPSGSFTVRRLLAGPASGRIVATATALAGGERCRAQISL